MDLVLFGLNHRTSPVEIRERLSFKNDDARAFMRALRDEGIFAEDLLVSTCNRTEVYGLSEAIDASLSGLCNMLTGSGGMGSGLLKNYGYTLINVRAVEHLFRVATGLDSMVIGEIEILGQLKDAYRAATGVESTGPFLNKLFQHCFRVGKRARAETGISYGGISIGSVAVTLASKVLGNLKERRSLIIGAGDTGNLVTQHLRQAGMRKFSVTNRTRSKAEELARELSAEVIDFESFADRLCDFDLVITAVGAPDRTVTRSMLGKKSGVFPLMIDLGVPRDIDPEIDKLPGLIIYNIDDLQAIVEERISRRAGEIPKVERIIAEETAEFTKWFNSTTVQNTIVDLRSQFENLRVETLKMWERRLSPSEYRAAEKITHDLVNRMLKTPLRMLKGCELECGPRHCETCEMFENGQGPVHGQYNQQLKCALIRMLFNPEEGRQDDR